MWKKTWLLEAFHRDTRREGEPNKQHKSTRNIQTFHTNPTMSEEGEWRRVCEERWLQKTNFNHPTRLGRLQARSGYIRRRDRPGDPGILHTGLRIPGGSAPDTGRMGAGYRLPVADFPPSDARFAPSNFHFLALRIHIPVSKFHYRVSGLQFHFSNLHFHIFGIIFVIDFHEILDFLINSENHRNAYIYKAFGRVQHFRNLTFSFKIQSPFQAFC